MNCLDHLYLFEDGRPVLPDHTLYNIGLDAAPTDLVCVSPPGMLFYPNDALSFQRQLTVTGSGSRWGGLESKLPIAIVIPVFAQAKTLTVHEKNEIEKSQDNTYIHVRFVINDKFV